MELIYLQSVEMFTLTSSVNFTTYSNAKPIKLYTEYPFNLMYEFVGAVGFLSNLFVLFILLVFRPPHYQQTTSEFFIICQTIVNALAAFFVLTQTLFEKVGGEILVKGSFVDEMLCRLWLKKLFQWSFLVSSTYSVLALTVDRFIAVVYPIFYQTKFSTGSLASRVLCMSFVLFSMMYTWVYVVPTSAIMDDGQCHLYENWPNPTLKRFVGFLTLFVQFFIPLFVIIICYSVMILTLHKRVAPAGERIAPIENSRASNDDEVWSTHNESFQTSKALTNIEGQANVATKTCKTTLKVTKEKKGKPVKSSKSNKNSLDNAKISIFKTSAFLAATFIVCWSGNQVNGLHWLKCILNQLHTSRFEHCSMRYNESYRTIL